jgi:hypothetical protein
MLKALSLAFLIPAFALFGAFAMPDAGERAPWVGLVTGAAVGLYFGLGRGGVRPTWFASLFGPPGRDGDDD